MSVKIGSDYTKTAIELKNPMEVKDLLLAWQKANKHLEACERSLALTEEAKAVAKATEELDKVTADLKAAIELAGSYQEVADGHYALRYQRNFTSYNVEKWRKAVPKFVGIIEETIPNAAVDGLLKGKLVTEEQVAQARILTPGKPVFVIDVVEQEGK